MPSIVCPICGKQVTANKREELPHRPFCSQRCKQVDLGRWLTEQYVIREEMPPDRVIPVDDEHPADDEES